MAFNLSTKQVGAAITKVNATKLRGDIQLAVIGVIGHAMAHGSSPLVEALVDRMTLSPMLKKLEPLVTAYLKQFGPFVHAKGTGWQFSKDRRAKLEASGYDYDTFAEEAPMWDDVEKAAKKADAFDLMKEMEKLIAKAEKKNIAGECITAAFIPYLKAVKAKFVSDCALASARASASAERDTAIKAELDRIEAESGEEAAA
jgi:hypothetical protein